MTPPGISPYKISKDLEEKVKEAKQRKEDLDLNYPKYKKYVEILEKYGINKFKDKFTNIDKLYNEKKYLDAYELFISVKEDIENEINNLKNRLINETNDFIEKISKIDKNLSNFKNEIVKAPDDIEQFIEFIKDLNSKIRLELINSLKKKISILDDETKSQILNSYGKKIENLELMNNDQILSIIEPIKSKIQEYYMKKINTEMERMDKFRKLFENLKINLSNFKNTEQEALNEIKAENYENAINLIKNFNDQTENSIKRILNEILANLKKGIDEAKSLNLDIKNFEDSMNSIMDNLKRGNYSTVIELIKNLSLTLEESKVKLLSEKLEMVRNTILQLKENGFNVTNFLKTLETSRSLISSKKFTEAYETLNNLLNELLNIIKLRDELLEEIDSFINSTKEFSDIGIAINRDYLEKIRKMAFEDPFKAKEQLENYISNITKRIEKNKADFQALMKQIIQTLKDLNVNINELNEISKMGGNNINFLVQMNEFKKKLIDIVNHDLNISNFNLPNSNIKNDIKPLIDNIILSASKYDFNQVLANLKRIREFTMNLKEAFINEKLKSIKKILTDLSVIGLDLSEINEDIDLIEEDKEINDENKLNIYTSLEKIINENLNEYILPREILTNTVIKYLELEKRKGNYDLLSKRIFDLKNNKESGDYITALKTAMEIENYTKPTLINSLYENTTFSLIKNRVGKFINNIDKYLDDFKKTNLDSEDWEKQLWAYMDQLISLNTFSYLKSLINEISEIIEQTGLYQDKKYLLETRNIDVLSMESIYQGLENIKRNFRETIYEKILTLNLKIQNIPVLDLHTKIKESIEKYVSGQYIDSWKTLNNLEKELKTIEKDYNEISNMLKTLEDRINFFDYISLDLPQSKKTISNLKDLISKGDFNGFRDSYRATYLLIKDEIYNVVNNFLNNIEKIINEKKGKINTLVAEGLLTSARRILKLDNAVEAVTQALEALENIQELDMLNKISNALMTRLKISSDKFGFQSPKEFRTGFQHVQLLLHQGKYTNAITEMIQILQKFEELSNKITVIKTKIEEIKEKISVAVLFGVNTKDVVELYQKARNAFQNMEIDKSINLLDESIKYVSIEIEKILNNYYDNVNSLLQLSRYLGMDLNSDLKDLDKLIKEVIAFSFGLNGGKNLTNVGNELKKKIDYFNSMVPEINEQFEHHLMELESFKNIDSTKNGTADIDLLRTLFTKKLYSMIIDAFPLIDYKFTKFYVKYMIDYAKNGFTEISDKIIFSSNIDNFISESFKISNNSGNYTKNDFEEVIGKLSSELDKSIETNFNNKISSIKNKFNNIDETIIENLKQYLLSKDYRTLEIYFIKALILYSWINLINSYVKLKTEKINGIISEYENYGYDMHEEKALLKNLNGLTYNESIKIYNRIIELVEKKKDMSNISFTLKLFLKIGKDEIPGKLIITLHGKVRLNNVKVTIEGSLQKNTIIIKEIEAEHTVENSILLKPGEGEVLKVNIEYPWMNKIMVTEKQIVLNPRIVRGFTQKKATGEEKCNLCRGKIFKDLDMVICDKCGSTYHYQCAKRIGKCVTCNNKFDFSEEKDLEVSLDL